MYKDIPSTVPFPSEAGYIGLQQLNLGALSDREVEILERAIEGLTDQQIGTAINISASTVNSYWVRIRGKLGHLSRTELVSRILQQRALEENDILRARIAELESDLELTDKTAWNSENAEMLRVVFESHPDPILVLNEKGTIIAASSKAGEFFGLEPKDLVGCPLDRYISSNARSNNKKAIFTLESLEKLGKLGLEYAIFARAKDGSLSRVFLMLQTANLGDSRIVTCVVRSFAEEIQIRQARAAVILADAS